MPIRFKCTKCSVELTGDGASRHYLDKPTHKLVKISAPKPSTQIN